MSLNVLVTGAGGQLGKTIKELYSKNNLGLDFTFVTKAELDISKKNNLNSFFKSNNFNYCINCAAYTDVDKAESELDKAYEINVKGAKNLAKASKENNMILIHISTDFVFDGNKAEPYTEKDVPKPINAYGDTKLKGEKEIEKVLQRHFIIRTSWLYSEYGHNFMKTMLRLSKTRSEINIVNNQKGTPTYAGDLASTLIQIINSNLKDYGLYHYSNEGVASWYDYAKAIFDLSKINIELTPVSFKDYPKMAKRPIYSVLNKEKIKNKLGIAIPHWQVSLETALSKFSKS